MIGICVDFNSRSAIELSGSGVDGLTSCNFLIWSLCVTDLLSGFVNLIAVGMVWNQSDVVNSIWRGGQT